jgi:hypothetical protein
MKVYEAWRYECTTGIKLLGARYTVTDLGNRPSADADVGSTRSRS